MNRAVLIGVGLVAGGTTYLAWRQKSQNPLLTWGQAYAAGLGLASYPPAAVMSSNALATYFPTLPPPPPPPPLPPPVTSYTLPQISAMAAAQGQQVFSTTDAAGNVSYGITTSRSGPGHF